MDGASGAEGGQRPVTPGTASFGSSAAAGPGTREPSPALGSARPGRRDHTADPGSAVPHRPAKNPAGGVRTLWQSLSAAVGAVLGLVPHVLHHIGLVAGAAVVTGIGGSAVLYLLGLVFSIPILRRLWRRFHSWRALAAAVTVFTALFLVSALVIGPAISGESAPEAPPGPEPSATHSEHHEGP